MPTDHLWLRASPLGKQCGLVSLPDGRGGFLHICVLPKLWGAGRRSAHDHRHPPGTVSYLTAHELEHVRLKTDHSTLGALSLGVAALGDTDEGQIVVAMSRPDDADIVLPSGTPGQHIGSLIDLMVLAERARIRTTGETLHGEFEQSLLRFLQQASFVRSVVPLLFQARPLYRERTEVIDTPRGRVSETSLLLSQATGAPAVECTFDDLTMDSPLLRVMLSALRVVASDRLPRRIESLDPTLRARAVALTRHLHTITTLPPDRANRLADTLTLTPMERHWAPALSEARKVLRRSGVVPRDQAEIVEGFVALRVPTEKFWEQIVHAALDSVFGDVRVSADNRPAPGVRVSPPWSAKTASDANRSYPDFMFSQSNRVVVADAKYKAGRALSAADAYQLFAYSHLAALDGRPVTDGLIVSAATAATEERVTMRRNLGRDLPLTLLRLRYPEPDALRTQAGWSRYLAHAHSVLRDFAEEALA